MRISDWISDVCSSDLVISLIFTYFAIPAKYQYRALLWGILAVIVLRGLMIAGGAALLNHAYWVLYLFAAFLIFTGIRMFFAGDQPMDVANNRAVKFISSNMRIPTELHGQIGRASCRARVCQYVSFSVVAGDLQKK